MSGYYYERLSDKTGAHALLTGPIYMSNIARFVHFADGNDGNEGSYNAPFKTIDAAAAATGTGGFVVVKAGSAEILTAADVYSPGTTVIGETSTSGVPTASLANNQSGTGLFAFSAEDGYQFINLSFIEDVQTCSADRVTLASTNEGFRFLDCYFYEDSLSGPDTIDDDGKYTSYSGCTFQSRGATVAASPGDGLDAGGTAVRIEGCVFDDGPFGRVGNALGLTGNGSRVYNASLLRSALLSMGENQSITQIGTATQGAVVEDGGDSSIYQSGISDVTTGDALLTSGDVYVRSNQLYTIDSVNGSDSTGDGSTELPYASLSHAITTNGNAEDVYLLKSGHTETLSSAITLSSNAHMTIIGEGDPAGTGVEIQCEVSTSISVGSAGTEFRNIKFTNSTALTSGQEPIQVNSVDGVSFVNCRFESGDTLKDTASGFVVVDATADWTRFVDCTFISTATTTANRPQAALVTSGAEGLLLSNVTFNGGTKGYSSWAFDASAAAESYLRGDLITLSGGADIHVHADSDGYLRVDAGEYSKIQAFTEVAS